MADVFVMIAGYRSVDDALVDYSEVKELYRRGVIDTYDAALISKRDDLITRREYARLDVSIVAPNRIEVRAERVQRYSLFLNEQLIDSSKPLVVLTNGQVSFEGPVTPSLEILLRQARLRQDSRQLFPIHLAIKVRKQPS